MDFRTKLAKWGYNKGNSIDVETLVDEILPELFSKQERSYSEEEVLNLLTHFAVEIQRQNKQGIVPLRIKEWFYRNKKK
jgi:hypothetical protein